MEDKDKRRRRNARYYLKQKRGGGPSNLIQLFPDQKQIESNPRGIQHFLSLGALVILCLCLTLFLMGETIRFFSEMEGWGANAFLKGFLCEGIVVAFSLFKFRDFFSRCMQHVVLIGMCLYSLWAISSGVIVKAHQEYREYNATRQMITDLEVQIREKDAMTEKYLARDWISAAKSSQNSSDVLKRQLLDLRNRSADVRPPQLILNSVLNSVLFRLIVMMANILCVRRLKEMLSFGPGRLDRLTFAFNSDENS
jgi:hypothetical protein